VRSPPARPSATTLATIGASNQPLRRAPADGVAGVSGAALNASDTSDTSDTADISGAPLHYTVAVRTLCDRIINAQQDEITAMQRWLRDRNQTVPEATAGGMKMVMNGMMHDMLMPGMLSEAQMKSLDEARGAAFDRQFLSGMIQHHKGAVSMVSDLFNTYGAAQDELTFKFASDVQVDQTTEINRMERMLFMMELEGH